MAKAKQKESKPVKHNSELQPVNQKSSKGKKKAPTKKGKK